MGTVGKALITIAVLAVVFQSGRLIGRREVTAQRIAANVFMACANSARANTPLHDSVPLARDIENCLSGMHAAEKGEQ
jgi:pyrrolidone-carboxylate peptidase